MRSQSSSSVRSRAVGRRWRGVKFFAPLAVLWFLAACGPPEQPPFEVRNELDQLVVDFFTPSERGKSAETMAKRNARGGVVAATGQFLLETFPKGTPVNRITEYFEGIGAFVKTHESRSTSRGTAKRSFRRGPHGVDRAHLG